MKKKDKGEYAGDCESNYQKGFNILMDYFEELSPESRIEIDKELKKLDL